MLVFNSNFSFGNIKDEIRTYIKDTKPDIIVLGQRDSKPLKFIGDSITHFLLKEFSYVAKKLEISNSDLRDLFNGTNKSFKQYKNKRWLIGLGAKILSKLNFEKRLFR